MKNKIWFFVLLSAFFLLLLSGATFAQNPTPEPSFITDDQVNAVAKQLYCPVCENTPLDVCATQACAEWRDLIREQLSQGWSEQQVKDYFVNRYGTRVLAAPPARGLNWLVYIIPPVVFLLGIWFVYQAFISWKNASSNVVDEPVKETKPTDNPYIDRLEDELRKL